MNESEYLRFEQRAFDQLASLNNRLQKTFNLGNYARYDFDQRTGDFVFSDRGVSKVMAKFQVVGSTSEEAGTWLWSWANASILEHVCDQILRVREFGEANGISKLTEPKWFADEEDGWRMAAVSVAILNAKGAYRCPSKTGPLFVIFTDIQFVVN